MTNNGPYELMLWMTLRCYFITLVERCSRLQYEKAGIEYHRMALDQIDKELRDCATKLREESTFVLERPIM